MLEFLDSLSQISPSNKSALILQELVNHREKSSELLNIKMQSAKANHEAVVRQELESMLMYAERSIANEEASRTLSSVFNKFSLLQKIMQTMG
jgi:hypothetical protein